MLSFSKEDNTFLVEEGFQIEYYDLAAQAAYSIDETNQFLIRARADGTYTASFYSYTPGEEPSSFSENMESVSDCISWVFSQMETSEV